MLHGQGVSCRGLHQPVLDIRYLRWSVGCIDAVKHVLDIRNGRSDACIPQTSPMSLQRQIHADRGYF
eukprot:8746949-Karenia_brevis.AAC.1